MSGGQTGSDVDVDYNSGMEPFPPEAERLLAVGPEDFVAERARIARALRDEGRQEDARAVAELRKPPAVVLAVNRAARDRPQAARDAAAAADRVRTAQFSGASDEYGAAAQELDDALALLAEVAVAQLSRRKPAGEATRRRVSDVLRAAIATEETRAALAGGVLVDEPAPRGFEAFAGLAPPKPAARPRAKSTATSDAQAKRQAQERALREQVTQVRDALEEAEARVREATRERDRRAQELAKLEAKLDRD